MRALFHITTGATSEMPVLLGLAPATILDAKTAPRSLDLAITQRLVIELNGVIAFTSSPGRGTTFRVELPGFEA